MDAIFTHLRQRYAEIEFPRLWRWATKGGWALLDQGLFSGANFLVNILLARWLPPKEYGAFAVALSIFYLLAGFHTAVLTEPMLVFGAGKYREHFRDYLGMLLWGHWAVSAFIVFIFGTVALIATHLISAAMAHALTGLAIGSSFLLLFWLIRRVPYVETHPQWATVGSAVNLIITIVGLLSFKYLGLLSTLSSFVILGLSAAIAAVVTYTGMRSNLQSTSTIDLKPSSVFEAHWRYGSRNLVFIVNTWQTMLLLLGVFEGLTATAVISSIWTLYRPITLVIMILPPLLLPSFARFFDTNPSKSDSIKRVLWISGIIALIFAAYGIMVSLVSRPLLHFLFKGKYDHYTLLVPLVGIVIAVTAVSQVLRTALKASYRIGVVAVIHAASLLFFFLFFFPMTKFMDMKGALLSATLSYIVEMLLLTFFWMAR